MEGISCNPGFAGWVRAAVPDREQLHPNGAGWGFPLKCSLIRRGQPPNLSIPGFTGRGSDSRIEFSKILLFWNGGMFLLEINVKIIGFILCSLWINYGLYKNISYLIALGNSYEIGRISHLVGAQWNQNYSQFYLQVLMHIYEINLFYHPIPL